jgi:hypothetical protein
VLPLYLLAALTGLSWSYEWYRDAVFAALGAPMPQRPGGAAAPASAVSAPPDAIALLGRTWPAIAAATAGSATTQMLFPDAAGKPLEVRHRAADAPHERATDKLVFDAASGELRANESFAAKPAGARLAASLFELHRGSYLRQLLRRGGHGAGDARQRTDAAVRHHRDPDVGAAPPRGAQPASSARIRRKHASAESIACAPVSASMRAKSCAMRSGVISLSRA